ncbi:PE-PGRS family protein PE_PGRS61-like [Montipora capricornis]|uniref:PE-PGRS family protein PE_PGRS61-like n=1 Tax=Montipora capricornis TaxID=246305 RepID=UPI0035F20431
MSIAEGLARIGSVTVFAEMFTDFPPGTSKQIGTNAGGGGQSSVPVEMEVMGKPGSYPLNTAPHCYDRSAEGGNAGSASHGGGGGDSCGNVYGGGGGGGGLQFGSMDFGSRLSYGGGGGGGGGSAFSVPGGRGGNGGGLVYLQVDELTLDGEILAKGQAGQCLSKQAHRSAPGGSGAGGSVVILTKKLKGNPSRKISISGGDPVKCAFGAGGGGGGGIGRWVVKEGRTVHQG